MFNTRASGFDETRKKPDVSTMRISSFLINNAGKNPTSSGQKLMDEGTTGQPIMDDTAAQATKQPDVEQQHITTGEEK